MKGEADLIGELMTDRARVGKWFERGDPLRREATGRGTLRSMVEGLPGVTLGGRRDPSTTSLWLAVPLPIRLCRTGRIEP